MITSEQVKIIAEHLRPSKSFFYNTLNQVLGLLDKILDADQETVRTAIVENIRKTLLGFEIDDKFMEGELEKDARNTLAQIYIETMIEEVGFAVDAVFKCTFKKG